MEYFDLDILDTEKAVRREYARLIREIRPDEDPLRFSDLHAQYKGALAELRYREEHPDEYADENYSPDAQQDQPEPVEHQDVFAAFESTSVLETEPGPIEDAPPPSIDVHDEYAGFVERFRDALRTGHETTTLRFLRTDDELYDLESKDRFSQYAYDAIIEDERLVPSTVQMRHIEEFFGWPGDTWLHDVISVRRAIRDDRIRYNNSTIKGITATLSEPNTVWNNLRLILHPTRRFALSNWIEQVRLNVSDVPEPALESRVDFIEAVGRTRNVNPWNLLGLALPIIAILVLFFGPVFLLDSFEQANGKPPPWLMAVVALSYIGAVYFIYVSFQTYASWLGDLGSPVLKMWAWRIFIGALAIFAIVAAIAGHPVGLIWLAVFAGRWIFSRNKE